ncbi:o-succinylbenzoate synthase [Amycolatopsis sp. NPDC098790]|uniref:o-succinylbenzoate synthase n=1 Tax=Amycolatopsis sp. NPDC098790 TaxID=3363939 RepID=UPI0037F3CC51
MKISGVELVRIELPLTSPFRTSFAVETVRDALLVRVVSDGAEGWGECVALADPVYSSEYVDGCIDVLKRHFVPALVSAGPIGAHEVSPLLSRFHGHRMAKSALEMAVLDAELREEGRSYARELGATRTVVPCGVSVGIMDSHPELLAAVGGYLEAGYRRIKLKIEPGWDVEAVRAVRREFGDSVPLQVDANTAYRRQDVAHLRRLDEFGLLLIEQPLPEEDLRGHAMLAARLETPVCLDESIVSAAAAADAITLSACSIVNVKPGRVGGYLEARRVHDVCAAHGVPVWCGGMLETGIGRAANLALAALPNFVLPGDISASERYYAEDITTPFTMADGHMAVPEGAGLGVAPIAAVLDRRATHREWLTP